MMISLLESFPEDKFSLKQMCPNISNRNSDSGISGWDKHRTVLCLYPVTVVNATQTEMWWSS